MFRKILVVLACIAALTMLASAADVSGKWVAQVAGRNGATQEMTFQLKVEGGALTGTVTGGGGGGRGGRGGRRGGAGATGAAQARPISDGKIDGDKVTFSVKVENNGQTRVTNYAGTVSGDTLQLKQTRTGGRNGDQTTEISAKRSAT